MRTLLTRLVVVGIAFVVGLMLWNLIGEHFSVSEPWDEGESRRVWQAGALATAFVLGLTVAPRDRRDQAEAPQWSNPAWPFLAPFAIGESIALGSLVAMLFRSPEATFWIRGAIMMAVFGAFFSCAAASAVILRWLLKRAMTRS